MSWTHPFQNVQSGMAESAVVIGGGLAGLAATVALADHGVPVTLIESRPRLGGRASSFLDQETQTLIDNCQHVSMGCCTNFRHFCETIGVSDLLKTQDTLFFVGRDGRINSFSASRLPVPLHLLPAFRRLSYLSREDQKQLQRGLRALGQLPAPKDSQSPVPQPFERWLIEHGQSPRVRESFWHVVLVSALSETLDQIDTYHARKVFFDGFLAHREGWKVQIPTVPLGELYGPPLLNWLAEHHVEFHLSTGFDKFHLRDDRVQSATLRDGTQRNAEYFVLAVPHYRVLDLLPKDVATHPQVAGVGDLQSAPISSVHLWFDRPITDLPHAVLVDRLSQWMFNRSILQTQSDEGDRYYYQVVISASRDLKGLSQADVVQAVIAELAEIWPAAKTAELLSSRVVTEHRAVFSVTVGSDALRPPQQSPIANLQLAGDWTQTGWPATMEGAVRSGYLAAENILAQIGRPASVLQPDLPVSLLTRLLLGGRHET
ncbi:MAG: hydroxysqualene dehydroxylase HpnE [Planctomycetaceae bacterium]|nr:hydroxysqualene dehydroxylase HpnE [Planctomycetaceae bacterium]